MHTAAGAVIPGGRGLCCAGREVPELARLAGATSPLPLVPWQTPGAEAPGLVVHAGPVSGLTRMVHAPDVHPPTDRDGSIHLEAPDAPVDLHTPDAELRRWADELLRRARRVIRGLDEAEVTGYRVCVRPMPADGQSIVGVRAAPGVYVAVTHSGVTLGAYLGQLITAEVASGVTQPELAPYQPDRFSAARVSAAREHVRVQRAGQVEERPDPGEQRPLPRPNGPAAAVAPSSAPMPCWAEIEAAQRCDQGEHGVFVTAVRRCRGDDVDVHIAVRDVAERNDRGPRIDVGDGLAGRGGQAHPLPGRDGDVELDGDPEESGCLRLALAVGPQPGPVGGGFGHRDGAAGVPGEDRAERAERVRAARLQQQVRRRWRPAAGASGRRAR